MLCGTFDAKGAKITSGARRFVIERYGEVHKLVESVSQITFSGRQAVAQGQEILYVTERAMFALTPEGVRLTEIAPGIDLQADVLDRMGFAPVITGEPKTMNPAHFTDAA